MGRKKKQIVNEQHQDNIVDTIKYHGDVTLNLILKNGKINKKIRVKNQGTEQLFLLLANCLIGNNVINSMPNYIGLYNQNKESLTSKPIARNDNYIDVSDGYKAVFSFMIPYNVKKDVGTTATSIEVRLYGYDDTERELAKITLSNSDLELWEKLAPNTTLQIIWKLYFSN